MAKGIIRVKAKATGGMTKVKMMAKHNMETGRRKDVSSGENIPAKYLQQLQVMHQGKTVFSANLGTGISKNPFFAFSFAAGEPGEEMMITWLENTGETATESVKIK